MDTYIQRLFALSSRSPTNSGTLVRMLLSCLDRKLTEAERATLLVRHVAAYEKAGGADIAEVIATVEELTTEAA